MWHKARSAPPSASPHPPIFHLQLTPLQKRKRKSSLAFIFSSPSRWQKFRVFWETIGHLVGAETHVGTHKDVSPPPLFSPYIKQQKLLRDRNTYRVIKWANRWGENSWTAGFNFPEKGVETAEAGKNVQESKMNPHPPTRSPPPVPVLLEKNFFFAAATAADQLFPRRIKVGRTASGKEKKTFQSRYGQFPPLIPRLSSTANPKIQESENRNSPPCIPFSGKRNPNNPFFTSAIFRNFRQPTPPLFSLFFAPPSPLCF